MGHVGPSKKPGELAGRKGLRAKKGAAMLRLDDMPGQVGSGVVRARTESVAAVQGNVPLLDEADWRRLENHFGLSPRQGEIGRLMCTGHSYKAIALHMGISINTVRMHVRALFNKLGVHDRVGVLIELITAGRATSREPRTTR